MLLNILVFFNLNICFVRTIYKKVFIYCLYFQFRFNFIINLFYVNLCVNKDIYILNIRNVGNKFIFNFVFVFYLLISK